MTQLDRIEQKLDRLLAMMGGGTVNTTQVDDFKTVLATGGIDALKSYVKNMPSKKKTDDKEMQVARCATGDAMPRLHPDDMATIASMVVRMMKEQEERKLDFGYLATLPVEERQRIFRANAMKNKPARRATK